MGRTQRIVIVGMLAAIAFILMATVQIPILPNAPYLTYDPSDAIALLAGVTYGPPVGVMVVLIKDILFLILRARGPFGPLADFVAASTFVGATAWAFRRRHGPFGRRLFQAAVVGAAARVLIMIPANFVILDLQFGMVPERVAHLLLPALIPFNAVKAGINAVLALLIAEPFARYAFPGLAPDRSGRGEERVPLRPPSR